MPRFVHRVTARLEGKIALTAIVGFAMFSATFALATVVSPARELPPVVAKSPAVELAEREVKQLVDERIHMHLKRLHELAPAASFAQ